MGFMPVFVSIVFRYILTLCCRFVLRCAGWLGATEKNVKHQEPSLCCMALQLFDSFAWIFFSYKTNKQKQQQKQLKTKFFFLQFFSFSSSFASIWCLLPYLYILYLYDFCFYYVFDCIRLLLFQFRVLSSKTSNSNSKYGN